MSLRNPIAITAVLAVLAIAGCGDDEEADPASGVETTAPATTSPPPATATTTAPPPVTTTDGDTGGYGGPGPGGDGDFAATPCPGAESPPNIVNVLSYGADCAAVEAAMEQLRGVRRQFRIGDFSCERVSGGRLGGSWECLGEASYFSFDFGD